MTNRLNTLSLQISGNSGVPQVTHFIRGVNEKPSGVRHIEVMDPSKGRPVAYVVPATAAEIDSAVSAAREGFKVWSELSVKQRCQVLMKFRELMMKESDWFVDRIVLENGKNKIDALASFLKGIETVDFACGLPALIGGSVQDVSSGVTCQDRRDPVGVVVSIVPFNFPVMVPLWTIPIALATGNSIIIKPSEKVPSCVLKIAELLHIAGVPNGAVGVLQGDAETVRYLSTHRGVDAVTFVGSTPVAKAVFTSATQAGKRALCLGGAKNHLIAMPDADIEMASSDIVASFAGSAGQRCMAASVLVLVRSEKDYRVSDDPLVKRIILKATQLSPGQQKPGELGPVIDKIAQARMKHIVDISEKENSAQVLLDGRRWMERSPGFWFGPTILLHRNRNDMALKTEIFGPVLSILVVESLEDALRIEQESSFGNAACIYTSSGAVAQKFAMRATAGMIGVNIGVPVPREPFSFGGSKASKFGIHDITGDGAIEFFTVRKKVTTKWTTASQGRKDVVADSFVR